MIGIQVSSSFQAHVENVTLISSPSPVNGPGFTRASFRVLGNTLASASTSSSSLSDSHSNMTLLPLEQPPSLPSVTASNVSASEEPQDRIALRHSILASLPLPTGVPDDALRPISIPAPFTLHEFLGNTTGVSGVQSFYSTSSF